MASRAWWWFIASGWLFSGLSWMNAAQSQELSLYCQLYRQEDGGPTTPFTVTVERNLNVAVVRDAEGKVEKVLAVWQGPSKVTLNPRQSLFPGAMVMKNTDTIDLATGQASGRLVVRYLGAPYKGKEDVFPRRGRCKPVR